MPTFKDIHGREWTVSLDAPLISEVRSRLDGFDLASGNPEQYQQLFDDPVKLVDVLWVLCEEQAKAASVTDIQFGKSLRGDPIEDATAALLKAILDFFPRAKRALLTAASAKNEKLQKMGIERALERINDPVLEERLLAALDREMDNEIERILTRSSSATSSPASVELAPVDSRSEN